MIPFEIRHYLITRRLKFKPFCVYLRFFDANSSLQFSLEKKYFILLNFDAAPGFITTHKQGGIIVAEMGFITNLKMGIMCFLTPIRY